MRPAGTERTVWTRVEGVWDGGLDMLAARFAGHRYAPHVHDEYAIGLCVAGVERFSYRGRTHLAGPGAVVVLEPGEPHTGEAAVPSGWAYDALPHRPQRRK